MYYQLSEVFYPRENIYEEKKYSLLRNLYLLISDYTTKTSLTIINALKTYVQIVRY